MFRSPLLRISLLLLLVTGSFACRQEQNKKTEELILGRWEIQEAFRNGRPTESLAELYFEFLPDGKMSTNLTGAPENAHYEIDGNQLRQTESQLPADYIIEELSDTALVLTTQLRGFDFQFRLHPVAGQ